MSCLVFSLIIRYLKFSQGDDEYTELTTGSIQINGGGGICDDDGDDYFLSQDRTRGGTEEVCAWEMENYNYTHRDRNDNFCLVVIRPSKLGLPEGTLAVYEMTLC